MITPLCDGELQQYTVDGVRASVPRCVTQVGDVSVAASAVWRVDVHLTRTAIGLGSCILTAAAAAAATDDWRAIT